MPAPPQGRAASTEETSEEEEEEADKTAPVVVAVAVVVVVVAVLAAAGLVAKRKLPLYRAATNPFSGWWQEKHKNIAKTGEKFPFLIL